MALIGRHGSEDDFQRVSDLEPLLDSQSIGEPSQGNTNRMSVGPRILTQYATALCATLGAMAMGGILGYSSPAGIIFTNSTDPDIHLGDTQNSLFSSISNFGALLGCPLAGFCINYFGRRGTILISVVPILIGWILIAAAQNFAMLMIGRIVTGLYCSLISLTVPTYIAEFSSPHIRGVLGGGFQVMVVVGILFAYCMGAAFNSFRSIAAACAILPCICSVCMIFAKESPIYLLSKGRDQEAEDSLKFFRGAHYEGIQAEMQDFRDSLEESKRKKASFKDLLKPYVLTPFLMSIGLMFFQQFSGINAVLFNLNTIFADAGSSMSANLSSILIAIMQLLSTIVGAGLTDKAGRKILLTISAVFMTISLGTLGIFFYYKEHDEEIANNISWLPLASLIIYVISFSVGYGPIPWVMMSELFSPEIKELASSIATMSNWTFAFIVTLIYQPLQSVLKDFGVYWMFAIFCILNIIFDVTFIYETKGKTLQEITAHFGAPQTTTTTTITTTSEPEPEPEKEKQAP